MAFPNAQPEDLEPVPDPVPAPVPVEAKKPPEEPPKPAVPDAAAVAAAPDSGTKSDTTGVVAGSGGGSGKDGTAGSGPGSGGGVGSGVGTGKGSGVGAGTGAGNDDDEVFPPTVVALTILPIPVPNKVRPYKLVAYFEVDTLGKAKLLSFNPSSDRGYDRRIREMLSEIRFRPAVRRDGRAVMDTAVVTAEAPRG
jgi:hypothetical protein